ncbi:polyprenyl glycosylphosphotransferase [Arthrobacter sp. ERGS1:01]|nr:polyprenyl glycosylphosphotransferase [Arthrobacter sp. ERGS1:01]
MPATKLDRPKHAVWDAKTWASEQRSQSASREWWKTYSWCIRLTDVVVIAAVLAVAFLGRFGLDNSTMVDGDGDGTVNYGWLAGIILLVWMADLELSRSRDRQVFGAGAAEYRRVLQSSLRVFGAVAILMLVFKVDVVRGFFAVALPLGMISLVAARWIWRQWLARQRSSGRFLSDVVVLGNAVDVEYVIGQLKNHLSVGYRVAGVALTTLEEKMELRPPWYKIPVLSTMADISRVVRVTGASTVVVAGALPGGPETIQELGWRLEDMSTELVLASSLTNVAGPRVHFRPVEGLPLMHVELPQYAGVRHVFKRAMDIGLSAAALLILAPVLAALAVIVRLDSTGPALFRQERVGRNGEVFKMFKFRSMVRDAEAQLPDLADANESDGVTFKIAHDPRVTRCGTWMRKFSLDELPQFWNVLKGDMSLVGPRPPLKKEVDEYEKPTHRRLLIKPGITGLWQVSGRSNLPWEESVRLDLYYVENWSLTGDFIILWRTIKAVYAPVGAY